MTDYGIVVLGALAHRQGEVVATASLAALTGLHQPTVAKVAKMLLGAGLVETQRGPNGGYRLTRDAHSISLVHIIESIEGPIAVNDCVTGAQDPCAIINCCFMSGNWNKVNATVRAALDQMSLADLIDPSQIFPAIPSPTGEPALTMNNLISVEREDEPHGRNHPDN
jgi:FeS assembly SUF system regulator